jgi:hypothetical protein
MSDSHAVTHAPVAAGHTAPAPFSPEEIEQFQKNDKHAAAVIVGLMTSIFMIGLLLYSFVALSV